MGRGARKGSRKAESPPKAKAESAAQEPSPPPTDFSNLKPVPKNRWLLIVSAVLLALWFVTLIVLVFVSRS